MMTMMMIQIIIIIIIIITIASLNSLSSCQSAKLHMHYSSRKNTECHEPHSFSHTSFSLGAVTAANEFIHRQQQCDISTGSCQLSRVMLDTHRNN
jgi:hypothetical protein